MTAVLSDSDQRTARKINPQQSSINPRMNSSVSHLGARASDVKDGDPKRQKLEQHSELPVPADLVKRFRRLPFEMMLHVLSFLTFTDIWCDRSVVRLVLLGKPGASLSAEAITSVLDGWRRLQRFERYRLSPDIEERVPSAVDNKDRVPWTIVDRQRMHVLLQSHKLPNIPVQTPVERLWTVNGKLHREGDEPAVDAVKERAGCKLWLVDGVLHRVQGPAMILQGDNWRELEWFLCGVPSRTGPGGHQKQFWKLVNNAWCLINQWR